MERREKRALAFLLAASLLCLALVGPSTSYWGISHVPSDVLTGFQGAALSGWEPWDGGWLWREAGGDNRCFVRRLEPGWFCFEMRF